MTTKLELLINQLIINHQSNREAEGDLLRVKSPSMDRIVEESMRKMILMQEQVFKQQVKELHRVYNLQKKLMEEAERLRHRKERAKVGETTKSDLPIRHQTEIQTIQSFHAKNDRINSVKFDLEMPAETESRRSTPSSSIYRFEEQNVLRKMEEEEEADVEVELTLSIGNCTRKKRSKSNLQNCSTEFQDSGQSNEVQQLGSASSQTDKGEAAYDHPSSVTLTASSVYQENTRPHWLLQDLSFK